MKNFNMTLVVICVLFAIYGFQTNKQKSYLIYYENHDLQAIQTNTANKHQLGFNVTAKQSDLQSTDNLVFTAAEMGNVVDINLSSDELFYMGFSSPYEEEAIYMLTEKFEASYQVYSYNKSLDKHTLLFETGSGPNAQLTYTPFGFTDNPNVIYVEAVDLENEKAHLGILTFNLKTGEFKKLPITDKYMMRPLVSPDRKELYYTATGNEGDKDVVHGVSDKILKYKTNDKVESLIINAPAKQLNLQGLFNGELKKLQLTNEDESDNNESYKNAASGFKLPWNKGEQYCVTRDGSPRPPVSSLNNGGKCNYGFNHHGYKAIDFSNARVTGTSKDNIRASREGEVITANYQGANCTYGNLVKLLHDDGLISYYAHLSSMSVKVGDCVGQGQIIGKEGGTGGESCGGYGEHLHFEVRKSNASGSQVWVTFDEYGETTRQNDLATSGNAASNCGATNPPTDNAGNIAPKGSLFEFTTELSSTYGATKAFDGSTSTRWNSNGAKNFNYFIIQLDGDYAVNKFIIKHASTAGLSANLNTQKYRINYWDGFNWKKIIDHENSSKKGTTSHNVSIPITKWVALVVDKPTFTSDKYARIPEFEIYGTPINGRFSNDADKTPDAPNFNAISSWFDSTISAHPNIISNGTVQFMMDNLNEQKVSILIKNAASQVVKQIPNNTGNTSLQVDVSHLSAGIYFYHLQTNQAVISKVKKLIIRA